MKSRAFAPKVGGGRIGAMLRSEALPPEIAECLSNWPESLRGIIAMMLESPSPMFIAWGPELRLLYNDQYADQILAGSEPGAMCAPVAHVWRRLWPNHRETLDRIRDEETFVSGNIKLEIDGPDGLDFRWFTFSLSPLRDDDGRVGGIVGVGIDTTAAVLSEDRLLYERNRIRDLFQQAPGFMAMGSGAEHVFEFANDAFYSLVGDRELIGRSVREALPELSGQGFYELLDQAYATGKPIIARDIPAMLARYGPGELDRRFVDIIFQPIQQDGAVVGILAEGYDVTEQKKAKEEVMLLQSELIHASRLGAMSAMAGTLAHELNQPLTAIKAYVSGARRRLDDPSAAAIDEVKSALGEAGAATMRAGEIIKRLRTMVRRGEPEVETADFGTVVREAVALSTMGLADEGMIVREDIASEVPVRIDKVQIQQVVVNLFRNASEATLKSGRREIRVTVRRARGSALLEVDDSGAGIDPAEAQNIFSPLFTTKPGGLGVGLAISRTIVEAHRGTMWASASDLGGARLSVKLPLSSL